MKHEFSYHTAYWNPHYGVCCVYPGHDNERKGLIRFSPLGDDNRGTYNMRLMPLDKADQFLVPIPGAGYDFKQMVFTFDDQATAFLTSRELEKCFKKSADNNLSDPSHHDPYWGWERGRQEQELIRQGRYQEASASSLSAGAIIKGMLPKPPCNT